MITYRIMGRERLLRWLARGSGNGNAHGLLRIWPTWESVAHRLWPAVDIPNAPNRLFAIHFKRHRGRPVSLPDGAVIEVGDWVGEMHLDNHALLRALNRGNDARTGSEKWAIVPLFRDDLQALAAWIESGAAPRPAKAIVGTTVLGRGAVRLGFTLRPRLGRLLPFLDKLFVDGLLIIYTPEGFQRMTHGKTMHDPSREAWMSVSRLRGLYGGAATSRPGGPANTE